MNIISIPKIRVGEYDIFLLSEGSFHLDGGAVFGAIPRPQWEKKFPPDKHNRVRLGLNQLLIRGPNALVLCDTGIGTKLTSRQCELYGIEKLYSWSERLAPLGLTPADVTHVVFSHLHFDHAGGATVFADEGQEIVAAFPNASYFVQEGEWEEACLADDRDAFAYRFAHFLPLYETGRLHRLRGSRQLLSGIQLHVTGGHTRFHQEIIITDGSLTVNFPGDICPTPYHLTLSWHTSYDSFPNETVAARQRLIARSLNRDALVVFTHDPQPAFRYLTGSFEHPEAVVWHGAT